MPYKCPKCGSINIYIGAISVECGYQASCENYTPRQASIVQELINEVDDIDEEEGSQLDLWGDDQEDGYWGYPTD